MYFSVSRKREREIYLEFIIVLITWPCLVWEGDLAVMPGSIFRSAPDLEPFIIIITIIIIIIIIIIVIVITIYSFFHHHHDIIFTIIIIIIIIITIINININTIYCWHA